MEIDPRQQQATVDSARATERAEESALRLQRDEGERQRKLFEAGVTSRDAYDQERQTLRERQGGLRVGRSTAQDARRTLAYYTIRAPFEGVVGDIPVHVGDMASPANSSAMALTTVDENKDLEAYIYVPPSAPARSTMGWRSI